MADFTVETMPKVTRLAPKASTSMAVPENGFLPEDIKAKLEEIRISQGLSQSAFARTYLGLAQGSYSNILRREDPAGSAIMSKIRSLLDRPPPQRQLSLVVEAGAD